MVCPRHCFAIPSWLRAEGVDVRGALFRSFGTSGLTGLEPGSLRTTAELSGGLSWCHPHIYWFMLSGMSITTLIPVLWRNNVVFKWMKLLLFALGNVFRLTWDRNETISILPDWSWSCEYHFVGDNPAADPATAVIYYAATRPLARPCQSPPSNWSQITLTNGTILPGFASLMPSDTWICLLTPWTGVGNPAGQESEQRVNLKID